MRPLIVASSATSAAVIEEIREGRRPRLDYRELAARLGAPFVDDSPPWREYPALIRSWESLLKLDFYWARRLARKVDEGGYDLVISLSERIGIPLAHALDRGIRHLTLSHKPLAPQKLRLIQALGTFRRWDVLFTFSQAEADELTRRFHLEEGRVRPIQWGVDTDFYRPLPAPNDGEPDHIFSVGLSNRDYPTLIEAMRLLPHVECHISATSAWESHDLTVQDLPANVKLRPYDHPVAIRDAYARCRFVVVPLAFTQQWSAGCTSVLQAQSMGKPVVATALPGLGEYLEHNHTGLLVEPSDPAGLASAIDELWQDPLRASKMGGCGSAQTRLNRSLDATLDHVVRVAHEVSESVSMKV